MENGQKLQEKQQDALATLEHQLPDFMVSFKKIGTIAMTPGDISAKTKALITLSLAIGNNQKDCIVYHVKLAIEQKVTLEEIKELIAIAAYMGGGPALMAGEQALALFKQLNNQEPIND
jgi:AhpD family alkylhydroperoxidase